MIFPSFLYFGFLTLIFVKLVLAEDKISQKEIFRKLVIYMNLSEWCPYTPYRHLDSNTWLKRMITIGSQNVIHLLWAAKGKKVQIQVTLSCELGRAK